MSNILKSSRVIIDDDAYKLISKEKDHSKEQIQRINLIDEESKLKRAEDLSKKIVNNAKSEAEEIISDAYEKSKQVLENARNRGYDDGKMEGFNEGKNLAESMIEEALKIKQEVQASKETTIRDIEQEVVVLVISIIEKVLNKRIEEDHELILDLIQLGLKKCAFTENLVLRVSSEDYDFAVSSKNKILALSDNIQDITIKQDKSLQKGSCILDTTSGSIDSGIRTQLDHIKEIFEELLGNE